MFQMSIFSHEKKRFYGMRQQKALNRLFFAAYHGIAGALRTQA